MQFLEDFLREGKTTCSDPCTKIRPRFSLMDKTDWQYYPFLVLSWSDKVNVKTFTNASLDLPFGIYVGANMGFAGFCLFCLDKILDAILNLIGTKK